jgi:hypothetical protein
MKQQLKLHKIKSNPNNPRIIKNDKFKKLVNSIINSPGFMELRPVILDVDSMVIGGNMRLKAHHHLNRKEIWTDMFTIEMSDKMNVLALEEGRKTKTYLEYCQAFTIKDNVSSGEWEWDILGNEWDSVLLNEYGLDVWENQDDIKEEIYSKNINIPTYEPKNEKPKAHELFNTDKVEELIDKIKPLRLNNMEQAFLIYGAYRHTVFDYSKIADYYAHSSKEVQELMEDSALVIIDFKKAIENGYVQMTEYLMEIQKDDE